MPSPFPGMDPYLENAADWPGLHHLLITASTELLQPQLRSRGYYANIGERVWLSEPRRPIYPDVTIYRRAPAERAEAAAALLEADAPVYIPRWDVEVREPFIEIFDAQGNHVVTGIEFLSPANKSDPAGRDLYQRKQREALAAGVSLVEIDLLRSGQHVLDVPLEVLEPLKPWTYLVNVVRPQRTDYEVYPVTVQERLPRVGIPLKANEADVVLDLQAALDRAYALGPYPERIDYSKPPQVALTPLDASWAEQLLKTQGPHK